MSVPVAYYTTIFRPQFWGFFIFKFERAFSFYWACKIFGLLLGSLWWLHQMRLRSRGLIVFGAIWIFFSSYTQWWFSSPAMLPEMIACWAVCLGCTIVFFTTNNIWKNVAALAGFVCCGINFVLCLYPPYQVPLLLLGIAVLVGVFLELPPESKRKRGPPATILIATGLLLIGLILIPFWLDTRSTLELVAQTVYPGIRRSTGGALSFFKLFSGVLGFFEIEQVGPRIYDNIAEASNFYPLWPAALLITALSAWRGRTKPKPLFLSIGFFLIGLSLYCVTPLPRWVAQATLLTFSTERRTLLALGIANILFCCLFLDRYREAVVSQKKNIAAGLVCWIGLLGLLLSLDGQDPTFFSDKLKFMLPLTLSSALLTLFFWERARPLFPAVMATLLIWSNGGINPIMRGLSPLIDSAAFKSIDRLRKNNPKGKWIVFHTRYFAQLAKATGVSIFNGTKIIPDLDFFRQLDPDGINKFTYNRYANIACELPRHENRVEGGLVYPDFYILFLPPDLPLLQQAGYNYVVFPAEWKGANSYGFSMIERVTDGDLWIYRSDPKPNFSLQLSPPSTRLAHY
jgi:hypothetical protein